MTDGGGDANAMRPSSDGSGLPVIFKWTHGGQQALAEPELQIGTETSGRFVEKIESKLYQFFELMKLRRTSYIYIQIIHVCEIYFLFSTYFLYRILPPPTFRGGISMLNFGGL